MFKEIALKIADRPGGYTRILRLGNRVGDNAEMCRIELVDYNENMLTAKKETKAAKKPRTRRAGSKKKEQAKPETEDTASTENTETQE